MDAQTTINRLEHFTLSELATIIHAEIVHGADTYHEEEAVPLGRIAFDSASVTSGDVYWCAERDARIAQTMVEQAVDRNALCVVTCATVTLRNSNVPVLHVEDSTWALWQLANKNRQAFGGKLVTVTGSIGKSVAASMIATVLNIADESFTSDTAFANDPVLASLLNLRPIDSFGVIEVPLVHAKDFSAKSDLCRPDVVCITSLRNTSLDNFNSEVTIQSAISDALNEQSEHVALILDGEDRITRSIAQGVTRSTEIVGRSFECSETGENVRWKNETLHFSWQDQDISIEGVGRHFLTPALMACTVGHTLGIDASQIAKNLNQYQPLHSRAELLHHNNLTVIDDSQHAHATDMWAALEMLRDLPVTGRRVAIVGDMAELGSQAGTTHQRLGDALVAVCGAELVIACGNYSEEIKRGCLNAGMNEQQVFACVDAGEAKSVARQQVIQTDTVLVKGHKRLQLDQVVTALVPQAIDEAGGNETWEVSS